MLNVTNPSLVASKIQCFSEGKIDGWNAKWSRSDKLRADLGRAVAALTYQMLRPHVPGSVWPAGTLVSVGNVRIDWQRQFTRQFTGGAANGYVAVAAQINANKETKDLIDGRYSTVASVLLRADLCGRTADALVTLARAVERHARRQLLASFGDGRNWRVDVSDDSLRAAAAGGGSGSGKGK